MDWYYGCSDSDFLVLKDQQDFLDSHPSPNSWSKWELSAAGEGFNSSPKKCFVMDRNATESSSSSVCGGMEYPEQSFQQTALSISCDHHQLQDLSSFELMDDIILDSVIEDFPCVKNLHKSFFHLENQCTDTLDGLQQDIAASEFVPCNSSSKNCLDIEAQTSKFVAPFEQSIGEEAMYEQLSLEESTLQDLEMIIAQFPEKTRICFRDALYRLARNTKQQDVVKDINGDLYMQQEMPGAVHNETMRSEDKKPMETESNSVDRAVANLMFSKMESNILDIPLAPQVNMKQEVIESDDLQGNRSKALNVAQKSHYPQSQNVLGGDAVVPRFEPKDQQTATESQMPFKNPTRKSFMLEFG